MKLKTGYLAAISLAAALILELGCGPALVIRFPKFPEQTGGELRRVMQGRRKVGIVAVKPRDPTMLQRMGYTEDWSATVEAAVNAAISRRGYYTLIDVASRRDRLTELAYTQSGMTDQQKTIGQELATDGLLFIQMTNQPRQECKTEMVTSAMAVAGNLLSMAVSKGQARQQDTTVPTGALFLTVFIQAKLTNIETGQTVIFSVNKPFKLVNEAGNTECPSTLAAFNGALEQASTDIADNLSPNVVEQHIVLLDDVDDLDSNVADRIEKYLKAGNKWAESQEYEMAAEQWQNALNESGYQSLSALWNMAVYKWYSGDMETAEKYFTQALKRGGPDFMDGNKAEIWRDFRTERKRMLEAGESGS